MKKLLVVGLFSVLLGMTGHVTASATENAGQVAEVVMQEQQSALGDVALTAKTVTVPQGSTAKEIQEYLDENASGAYQLTVVIPKGTYSMTRSLYVYPNTTIVATGAKLVKQSGYGAMVEAKLTADDGGYDANHNITIDGGTWDSSPVVKTGEGTETFRFIHSNNITIKNATLCNVPEGSHLIVLAGVQNATVENCKFYGYSANWKKAEKPKEALQLDVVHSTSEVPTLQEGEILNWDDLPCDNITITGCEFYNFSRGIGSHTAVAGRFHTNITIQDNDFHDLADSAIRMYNYKDSVVSNNRIENVVVGVLAYTYIEVADDNSYFKPNNKKVGDLPEDYNITISNNTIKNTRLQAKAWGDGIRVIGAAERPIAGVTIKGNVITSTARYGIFATEAPNLEICGNNKVTSAKSDGILIENSCDNSLIYSNRITGAGKSGIAIYTSDKVKVYSNTISKPKEDGIYLIQAAKCVIGISAKKGNKVVNAGNNGIYLTTTKNKTGCTSTKVQYNTIKNAGKDGIGAYKSSKVTIKDNKITAKDNGIYINTNSTNAKITKNVISSAQRNGIWVSSKSTSAQVTGNKILKYAVSKAGYGIYVYQSGGNSKKKTLVQKNTINGTGKGKGKNGIHISTSGNTTLSANTVTKASGTGIYVFKSEKCAITKNKITAPVEKGIYVTTACGGAKITSNTVKKAGSTPISTYDAPGVVNEKNKIK